MNELPEWHGLYPLSNIILWKKEQYEKYDGPTVKKFISPVECTWPFQWVHGPRVRVCVIEREREQHRVSVSEFGS